MNTSKDSRHQAVNQIAERHDVSLAAVEHLLQAMASGHSTVAQFNHPDFGGMGQWSKGGMLMVGDMFNDKLKAKVAAICSDVAELITSDTDNQFAALGNQSGGHWWPEGLGHPASTGSQNQLRYAFFPESRRLAVTDGTSVTVYDTKDHRIGGVSQQQSSGQSLSFTSRWTFPNSRK